jgi:adenylylsulfate kinase-like enzyme
LQKASDIAAFLSWTGNNVIVSVVYPYKEARDYLRELNSNHVLMVELQYILERGRENFHVKDYECEKHGVNYMRLDTDEFSVAECTQKVFEVIEKINNLY